jgi:hypothetical protein
VRGNDLRYGHQQREYNRYAEWHGMLRHPEPVRFVTGVEFTFTALFMPSTNDNNSDFALSTIDVQGIPTMPEPATLLMLGAGLLGAGRMFRKKAAREDRKN